MFKHIMLALASLHHSALLGANFQRSVFPNQFPFIYLKGDAFPVDRRHLPRSGVTYKPNGKRECARRRRQLNNSQLNMIMEK